MKIMIRSDAKRFAYGNPVLALASPAVNARERERETGAEAKVSGSQTLPATRFLSLSFSRSASRELAKMRSARGASEAASEAKTRGNESRSSEKPDVEAEG